MSEDMTSSPELDNAIERTAGIPANMPTAEETTPMYRKMQGSKVPVSKTLGKLWKSRIDQGIAARKEVEQSWDEAVRYYLNDQMSHRRSTEGRSGNRQYQRTINDKWSETENVVFSNVVTMLPMLYAKNPSIEVTAANPQVNEEFANCCKLLLNTLLSMKTAPGLNFKNKARRGVLWTLLTNSGYAKVDFVSKDDSSEAAMAELLEISKEYAKPDLCKDDIYELEGQLMALEEKVSILNPSGPKVTIINPKRLVIDPHSVEPDHSDAQWIAEYDYLPTAYLMAVYAKENESNEQYTSVYEPTHILKSGSNETEGREDDENSFSLFQKETTTHSAYGYENEAAFKKACYTKVWWVWDKITRRVLLYMDNYWQWPLWVWDDPLGLVEFYPYEHLWFHETPEGSQPKGEVTYYLDQQDAINDIISTGAQARNWARLKIFYNKNVVSQDEVERMLNSDQSAAVGLDLPENMKLNEAIDSLVPPAVKFQELFNVESKFAAINRITGISDAQRGAQFKTNTTNEAIDFYQKNVDIRVDEKIDAIEDWIGMIAWKVLQLLAKYWTKEDVAKIIGSDAAEPWQQITDPSDLRTKLLIRIVGGSTDKPTSKNKKRAALQIGQVLGQFANSIPAAGIVALKVFERAFADDIVITRDDWEMIINSMNQQQQKAGAGPQGQSGQEAQGVSPEQEQQIKDQIQALPPEAQKAVMIAIQKGVPPTEALQQVQQMVQQQPQGQ